MLLGLLLPAGVAAVPAGAGERWIVQLVEGTNPETVLGPARLRLGVKPEHVFRDAMRGFAATLSGAQRLALLRDPRVLAVEPDHPIRAALQPQQVQPGTRRVRAPGNPDRAVRPLDVDIAILDTGIDPDHPDLKVAGGYNCTDPSQSANGRRQPAAWQDGGFGHGTHVAGIAAARDNNLGVAGVAAGARLWSVKVLDHQGLGYWSWVICGLDWVAGRSDPANSSVPLIEVVNMSLAGGGTDDGNCGLSNSDPLHRAICRVERAGVTIVAAAGNAAEDTAAYVPAAYDEVIAVSAMADYDGKPGGLGVKPLASCAGADDAFASFSNFGRDVDLIAPGVCVLSTLPWDGYGRMSGTSMAAPHAAGGAALYYLWEARHGRSRPRPQQVGLALASKGVRDWRTATDADRGLAGSTREPLLNVADFSVPRTLYIGATPATQRRAQGETAIFNVWIARLGGFTSSLAFDVEGLPPGAAWSFQPDQLGAPAGAWRRLSIELPASSATGRHDVRIRATSGALQRTVVVSLHVDGAATAASGGARLQLRSGVGSKMVALPGRVEWNAVSGATKYKLQVSRDGGPWQSVSLPTKTATSINRSLWPGSSYQHRVRAMKDGAWGPWRTGAASIPLPRYAPDDGVKLAGTWATAPDDGSYGGLPAYSGQRGATATLTFRGRSVSWIATRGPKFGKARVYIDGALAATVDLYASASQKRRVVFSASWPSPARHTIEIQVRGTSGRPRVVVDAVVFVRDR
ncbi:hypothetical protein BH23CHL6_BH23CHL6_04270 [soil metagenome]